MEAGLLAPASNSTLINPITPIILAKTIAFQVGLLGFGTIIFFLYVIPWLARHESLHPIQDEERAVIRANPILRVWFKNARRLPDHVLTFFASYLMKGVAFILLLGTLGILLTDVGWLKAVQDYSGVMILLMARASGQPNGAHLLSYIPLPLLGLYVAWKYRKDLLLDCYLGILVVAFGVAVHEGVWLAFYFVHYYPLPGFLSYGNQFEDIGFTVMCGLLALAFWLYRYRPIRLNAFIWPIVGYVIFMFAWFLAGIPVSTINNYAIGQGPFEITQWWADPWVNAVEILSWIYIAASFWLVVWRSERD